MRIFSRPAQQHFSIRVVAACTVASTLIAGCHSGRVRAIDVASSACTAPAPVGASRGSAPAENPVAVFDSAWTIINRTHWDTTFNGVNWKAVRDSLRPKAAQALTIGELRGVLTAMIGTLKQSHFSIIPAELSDASGAGAAQSNVDHSGGIEATIRAVNGELVVLSTTADGPAASAGLKPGFVIQTIDGCNMTARIASIPRTMDPRRAKLTAWSFGNNELAGPIGEPVTLVVKDAHDQLKVLSITRTLEPGAVTKFGNLPPLLTRLEFERRLLQGKTIGIIRFNIWMPTLMPALNAAIDSLRTADAIVLDIRGNFGGVGGMAPGVAGHFIDKPDTLGSMFMRGLTQRFVINPQRVDTRSRRVAPFAGPLALVVDELSISTTEIFAGGMQELGRARVFGAQTSGQALPSVAEKLPNGDILYHAIANFLSPKGQPLEGLGVTPDVPVPLTRKELLKGVDPALSAALEWAAGEAKAKSPIPHVTPDAR